MDAHKSTYATIFLGLYLIASTVEADYGDGIALENQVPLYHQLLSAPHALAHTYKQIYDKKDPRYTEPLKDLESFLRGVNSLLFAPLQTDSVGELSQNVQQITFVEAAQGVLRELVKRNSTSERCVNDTAYLLASMMDRQSWALEFLDASGKPVPAISEIRLNFVGDYDYCRSRVAPPSNDSTSNEGFRGNYCVLKAYIGPPTDNPLISFALQWGVCMPHTCTEQENAEFLAEALNETGLSGNLSSPQAEIRNNKRVPTTATHAAVVILFILGILMFAGTFYDVVFLQLPVWRAEWQYETLSVNTEQTVNGGQRIHNDDDELLDRNLELPLKPKFPKGRLLQALLAFSVYTNGSKILNTTQPPGALTCLHGIRFLSLTWVMLGHTVVYGVGSLGNTISQFEVMMGRWSYDVVSNAFPSVDTFFVLSGLLTAYVTIKEMRRKGWKINWPLYYFHRFWRLTPPYALCIVLVMGLLQYGGHGALWPQYNIPEMHFCEKYWWTNLLYVNNLIHTKQACFGHSWYLANDMQFFIVSPLILIPFYFNKMLGLVVSGIFLVTTMVVSGILSVQNQWPPSVAIFNSPGYATYFTDYYITPWCRIGTFVVGVIAGYFLAVKPPQSIRFSKITVVLGWTVAAATALACVYGLRGDFSGKHPSSVEVSALYNAISRIAWSGAVAWVIVACSAGYGGFVNTLLSWSPFVVLGRLTYMAYLIHPYLIYIYFQNMQSLLYLNFATHAMTFLSIMFVSYCVAFVMMLAMESPMIGLEKVFMPKKRKH